MIIDLRLGSDVRPGEGALADICGLPLLVRNLLLLERSGYRTAVILLRPGDRAPVDQALAGHPRIGMALMVMEQPGCTMPELASARTPLLYWPGPLTYGRFVPELVEADPEEGGALAATTSRGDLPPLLLSPGAAAEAAGKTPAALVAALEEQGRLARVPPRRDDRPLEALYVAGPAEARAAEASLLRSLRKPEDGVVANYDRYISLFFSSRLMKLPVHPNAVTVCAGIVGIWCGLLAAKGGYGWMLAGALLFQLNSILDGIDGEIARAKLLSSRTGEWLDTISDDASNLVFSLGAAVGCYRTWGSSAYLVLAVVIAVGVIMTAALEYHYLITVARSGDLNRFKMPWERGKPEEPEEEPAGAGEQPSSPLGRLLSKLKFLGRRDAFIFLFTLSALAGQMWIMVWLFALVATIAWTSILGFTLANRRRRQTAPPEEKND